MLKFKINFYKYELSLNTAHLKSFIMQFNIWLIILNVYKSICHDTFFALLWSYKSNKEKITTSEQSALKNMSYEIHEFWSRSWTL